jgi:hypothetical protein
MTSWIQVLLEFQRDWTRKETTVPEPSLNRMAVATAWASHTQET